MILHGLPGGMPAFPLPEPELQAVTRYVSSLNKSAFEARPEGDAVAGEQFFFGNGQCGSCHMAAGRGATNGPDLSNIGKQLNLSDLERSLSQPSAQITAGYRVVTVTLRAGKTMRGFARNQGSHDLQLQTLDGKLHFLGESEWKDIQQEKDSLMPPLQDTEGERQNLIAYLSHLGGVPPGPLAAKPQPIEALPPSMLFPNPAPATGPPTTAIPAATGIAR